MQRPLVVVACLGLLAVIACGGSSSTPSPTTPTATTYTLSGTVTNATTAAPIAGATVTIGDGPNAGRSATTDGAGSFSITGLQSSGFTVTVAAAGYVTATKGVGLISNQTITVQLAPTIPSTYTLSGVVTDGTSGGVLPNIQMKVLPQSDCCQGATTTTNASGRYSLSGVAGQLFLEASATSYQTQSLAVTVRANTTLDVVLQRTTSSTYTLSGVVTDAASGARLPNIQIKIVASECCQGATTWTNASGQYSFSGVSGRLLVETEYSTYYQQQEWDVTVSSNTTFNFALQPNSCVYALTSPKTVAFGSAGGSGIVTFTRTSGSCTWTASSTAPSWLGLTETSGTGQIVIHFTVAPNSGASRQGQIQVRWPGPQAGENIIVNQ
jgi:Carboxypeptidase regulatory-like domain